LPSDFIHIAIHSSLPFACFYHATALGCWLSGHIVTVPLG